MKFKSFPWICMGQKDPFNLLFQITEHILRKIQHCIFQVKIRKFSLFTPQNFYLCTNKFSSVQLPLTSVTTESKTSLSILGFICMKKFQSVTSHALGHMLSPPHCRDSRTVTPRTLERDVLYGRP